MIFLELVQTFYSLTLGIFPLFLIALILSSITHEYLSIHTFDRLLKENSGRALLASIFYTILLPASPAYRVLAAAIARRSGAEWTPILTFIGAGASAGLSTLVVTTMISWQFAILRLVLIMGFSLILAAVISKLIEPRFIALAIDAEIEPIINPDFIEITLDEINEVKEPNLKSAWYYFLRIAKISIPWFILSIFISTLIFVIISNATIENLFNNRFSSIWVTLLGLPFYFLSGAEVPIVYSLIRKGADVSNLVVFMLSAPLINIPMFITIARWLGYRRAMGFLSVCWLLLIIIGFIIKYLTG